MNFTKKYISTLFILSILISCNLEREIEIELPPFEPELVVECYLQAGQPIRLSLTRTVDFYGEIEYPIENSAEVKISTEDQEIILENSIFFNPETAQFANYLSNETLPFDYNKIYTLHIRDTSGNELTATTTIMPPVEIDTLIYKYNEDSLSYLLTRFQDDGSRANFYRRQMHKTSLTNFPEQDFSVDDGFANGETVTFGSGFEFSKGDTLISSIYHITEDYYNYFESTQAAASANGNPFATPVTIESNIEGGLGIFTGYSVDRDTIILP